MRAAEYAVHVKPTAIDLDQFFHFLLTMRAYWRDIFFLNLDHLGSFVFG